MTASEVSWPAFVKHVGDSELAFFADRASWDRATELSEHASEDGDILVDSNGDTFVIDGAGNRATIPRQRAQVLSHAEIVELVRGHLSVLGECCVAKVRPGSIEACMQLLSDRHDV